MTTDIKIVVTTPTGHVGSQVTRALIRAGIRPIVMARDAARLAPDISECVDVREGDQRDRDFVVAATAGADAVYWVDPTDFTAEDPNQVSAEVGSHITAAVLANHLPYVVFQSSVGAEKRHGAGLIDGLASTEEQLNATGANVLHLRCGYFFTNLLDNLDALGEGVLTTTLPPDYTMPWVHPRDIAQVAVGRLLARNWSGQMVQAVHGPADLTYPGVADILTKATGIDINIVQLTDSQVRATLLEAGMSEATLDGIIGMSAGLREEFVPEQFRSALTTTPTTLEEFAYSTLRPALQKS